MLISNDSANLGDKRLNAEEALVKAREDTHDMLQGRGLFLYKQAELEDRENNRGQEMCFREFIRRLELCNPALLIKEGSKGNLAIYGLKTSADLGEYDWTKPAWYNDHKYLTGFPKTTLPEFSSMIVDKRGIPTREIRGWRTLLINLIRVRAVTYRSVVKHFGEPGGERGWRWHSELQNYKG